MEIANIHLTTAHLTDLKTFYIDTLECPLTTTHADEFTVQIGTTEMTFSQAAAGTDPVYHFAINIPQNQFDAAVAWLAARVALLADADSGDREFVSEEWNSHQVYCLDPAGNILELIARHDLSNDSARPFGSENFRRVSEIGLPVPNVKHAVETIQDTVGVSLRNTRAAAITADESFAAVGDDHGLFIVVKEGRGWFPTRNQPAAIYPVTVGLANTTTEYVFPTLPYRITPT